MDNLNYKEQAERAQKIATTADKIASVASWTSAGFAFGLVGVVLMTAGGLFAPAVWILAGLTITRAAAEWTRDKMKRQAELYRRLHYATPWRSAPRRYPTRAAK